MNTRISRSKVTFSSPFSLPGYSDELPSGDYEVVVEDELIPGLSFNAWRRRTTYLTVQGKGSQAGRTEMRVITESNLMEALAGDQVTARNHIERKQALSSQKDTY